MEMEMLTCRKTYIVLYFGLCFVVTLSFRVVADIIFNPKHAVEQTALCPIKRCV